MSYQRVGLGRWNPIRKVPTVPPTTTTAPSGASATVGPASGAPQVATGTSPLYAFGMSPLLWGLVAVAGVGGVIYYKRRKRR